ncbi:MAG TPA: GNAT family N-acetyltransferase [Ktedonobacterales bacterium]
MFEIRPLTVGELDRLCVDMPLRSRAHHRSCLRRQQAGELLYLVAWEGRHAVGHVSLFWRPTNDPSAALADCPWIIDLLVHPDHRSRGAGSALVRACEQAARERGERRIGLAVAITNTRAAALYERLGYRDAGLDQQFMTGSWEDSAGVTHYWQDLVTHLIKPL